MTNTNSHGAKHASAAPTGEAQVDPSATPPPALWQPFDTVPKDGTFILVGRFVGDGSQWDGRMEVDACVHRPHAPAGFGCFNQWYPPTHWMPLPTRPVTP